MEFLSERTLFTPDKTKIAPILMKQDGKISTSASTYTTTTSVKLLA